MNPLPMMLLIAREVGLPLLAMLAAARRGDEQEAKTQAAIACAEARRVELRRRRGG